MNNPNNTTAETYFWKVVTNTLSGFISFIPGHYYCLEYEIGKKTIPKIGKIFIFGDYNSAENFMIVSGGRDTAILKVKAENAIPSSIRSRYITGTTIFNFWKNTLEHQSYLVSPCPPNTWIADSITPVEVVKS